MKKQLNIGFIGAGDVSLNHFKALEEGNGGKLIGLWNRSEERKLQRAKEFGCIPFNSPEELIGHPDVDVIFILTNLETHFQYAKMALEAGKNVFIEKPVGVNTIEIEEIINLAHKKNLICFPGHNMIYEDGIKRIKKLIIEERLGKVVSIYVLYNLFHSEELASRFPGVIRQIFTHNLYTLIYLGGLPDKVSAFKQMLHYKNLDKEDIAIANLKMKSGALAHICASFAADDLSSDPWTFNIKVIGTNGSARYTYQDWVESGKDQYHTKTYTAYQGTITNEVQCFLDICRYGGEPLSSMQDAVYAQKTLESIEMSIEKEKVIDVSL